MLFLWGKKDTVGSNRISLEARVESEAFDHLGADAGEAADHSVGIADSRMKSRQRSKSKKAKLCRPESKRCNVEKARFN